MKILISGAGIAGLSLARALQDDDRFDITLIEKCIEPPDSTAGIALPPNAEAGLRMLGVGEALDRVAHQVHRIFYTDAEQNVLAQASLLEEPLNYGKFVALTRKDLRKILETDLIPEIRYGTMISKINNTHQGVKVTFNTGHEEEYDLVVAADGIHSKLRELEAKNNGPLKDLGVVNWRFLLNHPTENIEPTYQFGDTQYKLFMTYPISPEQVYVYAHLRDPKISSDELKNIEFIKTSFAEFGGLAKDMLAKLNDEVNIITGRLQSVPDANFYDGKIAFVGDAANACSPLLQQGAAAALEDVLTLSTVLKRYPISKALEMYQSLREARVKWLIQASDGPLIMMENINRYLGDWFGATIRNALFYWKGPLNVAGWRKLFATNPLLKLDQIKTERPSKRFSDEGDRASLSDLTLSPASTSASVPTPGSLPDATAHRRITPDI